MHASHLGSSPPPTDGVSETNQTRPASRRTRVVFFDAEGTLWVTRRGHTAQDFWRTPTRERARVVFRATVGIHALLTRLREAGCRLVVLSRHDERLLPGILEEFRLSELFDDVLVNGDKGERAATWLRENGVSRESALMVGDREDLDIVPMRRVGIRAVLVDRAYNRHVDAPRLRAMQELVRWL